MSKRLLVSVLACVVLFGAASYLPTATEKLFAPAEMSGLDRFEVDQCSAGDVESLSAPPYAPVAATYTPEPQRDERKVTVYITDTGAKYHSTSCRHLRRSKHPISLRDAKAQGYGACKVCRPPQ
jgi:hypothetical protein